MEQHGEPMLIGIGIILLHPGAVDGEIPLHEGDRLQAEEPVVTDEVFIQVEFVVGVDYGIGLDAVRMSGMGLGADLVAPHPVAVCTGRTAGTGHIDAQTVHGIDHRVSVISRLLIPGRAAHMDVDIHHEGILQLLAQKYMIFQFHSVLLKASATAWHCG